MVFMFGVVFLIAALIALIILISKMRRPREEAHIQDIFLAYHKKDKQQIKQHPHALVQFFYRSVEYKAKVHLLKKNCQIGDKIVVAFKEEQPENATMYAPKAEITVVIVLAAIGVSLIGVSIFVMNYFNLW